MPRHINPIQPARTAMAPYNFVPLPEKIFSVSDGIEVGGKKIKPWERHDEYVSGTSNGWIDLDITTLTPLYIRGAVTRTSDSWDERESRVRPEPYTAPDGIPVIPGSSLRGMIRNLVEILSFAKIQPVTEMQPFFRTVANDRIGRAYRSRMVRADQKPQGGILCIQRGSRMIAPCEVLRVQRQLLKSHIKFQRGPNYTPPWPQQHGRCWVKVAKGENASAIKLQDAQPEDDGWVPGTLVLTGNAPKKRHEFVFLDLENAKTIQIPDSVWNRFHDDDQITQWQEKAFPRHQPTQRCRKSHGHLRDGEPVFFLVDAQAKNDNNLDGLVFLGRAQMFRFPYDLSPQDLIPKHLRTAPLDLPEAIFGRVGREAGGQGQALKSRVFFEDAVAISSAPTADWFEDVLVPKILSAPKPTTFQHYLTQDGSQDAQNLTTYLNGDHTTIRGHKLYWHRWDVTNALETMKESDQHDQKRSELHAGKDNKLTQHTIIQPIKAGVTFKSRIRFENLTDLELGAILSALYLPEGCAHKLGMGKPLGLGSVQIMGQVRLVDRTTRYGSWMADGVVDDDGRRFLEAFTEAMISHAKQSEETVLQGSAGLRQLARLDTLFQLLTWENRPAPGDTRYMVIENGDASRYPADQQNNEFRTRPVLPSPHAVVGESEPPWPNDPPHPSFSSPTKHSLPKAGDRVDAELLAEKTKKGGWRAKHTATGIEGPIQNSVNVPMDKKPGDRLSLLVASANEHEIAFRYPSAADEERAKKRKDQMTDRARGRGRRKGR